MRRVCVTGGAGFIGSNFVDHLVDQGVQVRVIDNFRTGRPEFLARHLDRDDPTIELFEGNVLDQATLLRAFDGCDWVAHFQANADVRHGLERPFFDLEQNTTATANVLDAMRVTGVNRIFFASTASVYGGHQMPRIPEDAPFPVQQSLYGASKVACEALIAAYCEGFGFTGVIGRWVQIVGERYLHGHVIDFVRKLLRDPTRLEILGDGRQRKSGLYVQDLARGITTAVAHHEDDPGFHVYNLGTEETFTVDESADLISGLLNTSPEYAYTGRVNGGWVGDNPNVLLDTTKIQTLDWHPSATIAEAITWTVEWLLSDECTYL